jgi:hypothetical protein
MEVFSKFSWGMSKRVYSWFRPRLKEVIAAEDDFFRKMSSVYVPYVNNYAKFQDASIIFQLFTIVFFPGSAGWKNKN